MAIRNSACLLILLACTGYSEPASSAEDPDPDCRGKAVFVEEADEFKLGLATRVGDDESAAKAAPRTKLKSSLQGVVVPKSPAEFRQVWHHPPVCQQLTGNCWAYASTSFFESEIHRLSVRQVKLSELYTVYWEYVEKARRFVRKRGESEFPRGSQPNATIRIWRAHGIVPATDYSGLPPGRNIHADRRMYNLLRVYLDSIKEQADWDEEKVLTTVRTILDKYLGRPPERLRVNGGWLTPQEYLDRVVQLDLDDYVSVISFRQQPWYQWCVYEVPDNWWRSQDYFNIPLEKFTRLVREAAASGAGLCLGVDNSEPGFLFRESVAFIPCFDIPGGDIDDDSRQFRFTNGSTTDDHIVHLVGRQAPVRDDPAGGGEWYLIKDSGTRPQNGRHRGYMFYHEDFVRLKTLCVLLHREQVERMLARRLR